MTGGADHHLRRLVEKAGSLDEAVARLGKRNSHPLGLGIKQKRDYSTPTARLSLPTSGPALAALEEVVAQSVQDLDEKHSQACWQILLGAPGVVIPMPTLTPDEVAEQDLDPGDADVSTLRQIALVSVVRPKTEWDKSEALTQERFGGVGLLTLAPALHGRGSRMAWLSAQWASSTREFVSILEPHYVRAGLAKNPSGSRVAVVIDQDFAVEDPHALLASLSATAAVTGLHVTGLVRDVAGHQNIMNTLSIKEPPSHLIMLGSGAGMDAVQAKFRKTPAGAVAGRLSRVTEDSPLETLRERLTKIAGVSAALQPVLEPPTGFITMPITPVACLHDDAFVYVKARETGLWWTEDLDRHGGSVFKTYAMVNKTLRFEADRDAKGEVITDKWKGGKRYNISLDTLAGCGKPTAEWHLRVPDPDAA